MCHVLYRVSLWLGYRCLQVAWWAIGPVADAPRLPHAAAPLSALEQCGLDDALVGALFVVQDRRIRTGQERVH